MIRITHCYTSGGGGQNPYPYWHKICETLPLLAQNLDPNPYPFNLVFNTLSGTLLENPTLCGTEVGHNGTLAVLAYMYCHQWECPPGGYTLLTDQTIHNTLSQQIKQFITEFH